MPALVAEQPAVNSAELTIEECAALVIHEFDLWSNSSDPMFSPTTCTLCREDLVSEWPQ